MAETTCQIIGRNIRAKRQALKLTLSHLGRLVGVSYQQMQKYEKGSNRLPSDNLVKIAARLGCTPDELCGVASIQMAPEVAQFCHRLNDAPGQLRLKILNIAEIILQATEADV